MKCKNCGYENTENAKYCGKCGEKLERAADLMTEAAQDKEDRAKKKTKSNKKSLVILCASLLIIVGTGAAFFALDKVKEKQYEECVAEAERYLEELDYESAEASFLKAIDIDPKDPEARSALTELYMKEAEESVQEMDYIAAEETCLKALELEADNPELYLMQGDINRKLHKDSATPYEKALELDPELAEAYIGIMHVKVAAQEFDEVEKMLEKIKELPVAEDDVIKKYAENFENYYRYQAYAEKLLNTDYSSGFVTKPVSAGTVLFQNYGFCFARLVDFDGNGTNELVLCKTEASYDPENLPNQITDYVLEVWGYENGEMKQLFSGTPLISGVLDRVAMARKGDKWYICTGNTGSSMNMSYYTYENGEFLPEVTLEANSADLSRKINGKEVSQEEWSEIVGQFETGEFLLQGSEITDDSSWTGNMGFWEYVRVDNEVNYLENACYRAIAESREWAEGETPGIDYGEYVYRSDDTELYVSSYRYNTTDAQTMLSISFCNRGEYDESYEFAWNAEKGVYENTYGSNGAVLTYHQEGDKLFIELTDEGEVLVSEELQRDTQYDC